MTLPKPPMPARSRPAAPPLPPMRAPLPTDDGVMSAQAKMSLVKIAQQLRNEQLEARIVHYRADLETNSELDAITAQVVRELRELQQAGGKRESFEPASGDRAQLEIELIQTMRSMLERLFREGRLAPMLERKLAEVAKRFARLFFRSELNDKIQGRSNELKMMRFPEQALFLLFARNERHFVNELEQLQYANNQVRDRTKEVFANLVKGLRDEFLAKTTPELNELMTMLQEVLREFFTRELPAQISELSWEVVREARLADGHRTAGYKVSASLFPSFRRAFEARFLERLVPYTADNMLGRVRDLSGKFRIETLHFVADPQIFSDVCEVICESVYDTLYNDGFLDLPTDWRAKMAVEG